MPEGEPPALDWLAGVVAELTALLKAKRYSGIEILFTRHADGLWSIRLTTLQVQKFLMGTSLAQACNDARAWIDGREVVPSSADLEPWFDPHHPMNLAGAKSH
jgi:hypothetical protein